MRSRRTAAAAGLTALLICTPFLGTPASAETATGGTRAARPASAPAAHQKAGEPVAVTLITGDTVTVTGGTTASIASGKGREKVHFATFRERDGLRVVPTDALPLLSKGRLDPRLFDVTTLIKFGYDDAHSASVPLIVMGARPGRQALTGATRVRALPGGTAMRVSKATAAATWSNLSLSLAGPRAASGTTKVWLDGQRRLDLKESVPQIGAPAAWAAGYNGTGVKVGVVDSGVDDTHPDLTGRIAAEEDFTGDGLGDQAGHGTHVASTIASTGAAPGGYTGVAPGAQILAAKSCDRSGSCYDSAIMDGMQWAADQGAKVINLSLGATDGPGQDPLEEAVERITAEKGVLFVISAGNAGADESIGSPGSADSALTVGAVTKTDALASFSSRGPRIDGALKPDITAPGVDITAARSKDSPGPADAVHVAMSGTSMSAPHVTGAAAIVAQAHPDWTPAQLKSALMGSAKTNPAIALNAQGAGRVDVPKAIGLGVLAEPASVSFGRQVWPHDDDKALSQKVTYHNTGSAPVTLALSLAGAQAGMFSLSATSVTVPALGSADVVLTADTTVASPDGFLGGHLLATAGGTTVNTAFGVDKEIEKHVLKLEHIDRNGAADDDYATVVLDHATGIYHYEFGGGDGALRLPKGTYTVIAFITTADADGSSIAEVLEPSVTLDQERTVTLDARAADSVKVVVPEENAQPFSATARVAVGSVPGYVSEFGIFGSTYDGVFIGQVDPAARSKWVNGYLYSTWIPRPIDPSGNWAYSYNLSWRHRGFLPTGFTQAVKKSDLAAVQVDFAAQGPARAAVTANPWYDGQFHDWAYPLPVALPGKRTEYYTTGGGVKWSQDLVELDAGRVQNWSSSSPRAYQRGRTYAENRNRGVFGPSFDTWDPAGSYSRVADWVNISTMQNGPGGDWFGDAWAGKHHVVIERDGKPVGELSGRLGAINLTDPGKGRYTMTIDSGRGPADLLSTQVTTVYGFQSAHVDGQAVPLPLSAVRFAPTLDQQNTAPAGKLFVIPVEVIRQAHSAAAPAKSLTVDVSYDDGVTWSKAFVARDGQKGVVLLSHPGKAGFVSLRARSADRAGNTVTETIIRAYRIA